MGAGVKPYSIAQCPDALSEYYKGGSDLKFVHPIRDPKILEQMKQYLNNRCKRDFILFMVGINTGYRIGDILNRKVSDVREKTHISIIESKTGKLKEIKIRKTLRKELDVYIKNMHDDEYLFTGRSAKKTNSIRGEPITVSAAYKMFRKVAEKLGIQKFGTYSLRKTFGYHFYNRTKDIALLMDLFNHSEESITLRYIGILQDTLDESLDDFEL